MRPSSAKAKGRILQQLIRDKLLALFPHLQPEDVVSTSMGVIGEDVKLSPAARKYIPFAIEAKSRASIAVYPWLDQALGRGHTPLVVAKANRRQPIAILYLDDLLKLIKNQPQEKS